MKKNVFTLRWDEVRKGIGEAGLRSWDQAALRAGLSRQHLYALRSGVTPDPHLSTIVEIARALNLSLDRIVEVRALTEEEIDGRTKKPTAGVSSYRDTRYVPEEDALALSQSEQKSGSGPF